MGGRGRWKEGRQDFKDKSGYEDEMFGSGGSGGDISTRKYNQSISNFELSQDTAKTESTVVTDRNGSKGLKSYVQTVGSPDHVSFKPEQIAEMRRSGTAEVTHNHPGGTALSRADFGFAQSANLRSMAAFGIEKRGGQSYRVKYKLVRDKGGWNKNANREGMLKTFYEAAIKVRDNHPGGIDGFKKDPNAFSKAIRSANQAVAKYMGGTLYISEKPLRAASSRNRNRRPIGRQERTENIRPKFVIG